MASFLTSGSIRIVVAGMFDGMAAPFLVYHGATILASLRSCGLVIHIRREHIEHLEESGPAHAVRELADDRLLGCRSAGDHECPTPPKPCKVGGEVLGGGTTERCHECTEKRVDGVDPVDDSLRAILGIVGGMGRDVELGQHVDVGGRPVGRHDGTVPDGTVGIFTEIHFRFKYQQRVRD